MNTVILNILCEGQTEENFVRVVLKDYLSSMGIVVKPRLLLTNKKKNVKGGVTSYSRVKGDIERWKKEVAGNNSETHYFTTMLDFYALPNDFPGFNECSSLDPYSRVESVENEFAKDINMPNFIPYIQLHEFEALLFSDVSKLKCEYPKCSSEIDNLQVMMDSKYEGNPELINHGVNTAPSKRIIKAIEGKHKYNYNKPRSGAAVTKAIGINVLLEKCSHFNRWIGKIKKIQSV